MLLTLHTHIKLIDMLPILSRLERPVLSNPLIASLTHRAAVRLTAVTQQAVPPIRIVVAHGTWPVASRVAEVLGKGVGAFEASSAASAVAGVRLVSLGWGMKGEVK
jgi:hypothetical protein